MKNLSITALATLFLSCISATAQNVTQERRAANTCADPTLTDIYIQSYSPSEKAHLLQMRTEFADSLTVGNGNFQLQGEIFRAWSSPQEFTVPLYRLVRTNAAGVLDYVFVMSTDGTVPVVSGFTRDSIPAYVYDTQICGSVPLYVASLASATDHYYTTVLSERNDIVNRWGWTDQGIAAYVLPLNSDCTCTASS